MPAPGFKWNRLEDLNAQIFEEQQGWTWAQARQALQDAHKRLMDDIRAAKESDLYAGSLAPGLKWTRGRYAEAAGASHYQSAAKALRKLKHELDSDAAI